ncbi:MAG TPA: CDP-alcohol phosphatidyltransferase family protein [Candidatus Limnocylindria bacterium]|nr:CDP-alcohol phosphatidyltransferase family protein [Candidatus Limnocylindria bacterium]
MSASRSHARDLARGDSLVPAWVKEAGRAILAPIVRVAMALHVTPNTITVIGLLIVAVAAILVASGQLLLGAVVVTAGSALDAVDGALARANGGGTAFGSFLDSTLDRAGEAILYTGIAGYFLRFSDDPTWPVLATIVALGGSFMVSYARARAEGIGLTADVGLAPRTERVVLIVAGIALGGLGYGIGLIGAIIIIAGLTVATVIQRIWHVRGLVQRRAVASAKAEDTSKENA